MGPDHDAEAGVDRDGGARATSEVLVDGEGPAKKYGHWDAIRNACLNFRIKVNTGEPTEAAMYVSNNCPF